MISPTNLIVLDTDIFSEVARGRNPHVAARALAHQEAGHALTLSVASVIEIIAGWQRRGHSEKIDSFVKSLDSEVEVLRLTQSAAMLAGRIVGDLGRVGKGIGILDPLVAAIAMTHNRILVTGNTAHYQRIIDLGYDLELDNWRDSAEV